MRKKRLFAALLAATVAVGAFAFAGCGNGGDSGNGGPGKGLQVDGEQWTTEFNKFKLDENLSGLDNYTVDYEVVTPIENNEMYIGKERAYVNRKDKEVYRPNKPTVEDAERIEEGSVSTLAYFKLGDKYTNELGVEECDITQLRYWLNINVSNEVFTNATKTTWGYEYALMLFELNSLSIIIDTVKIGEEELPFAEAWQYFEYDEAKGCYKSTDIGICARLYHQQKDYELCKNVEIYIYNDSLSLVLELEAIGSIKLSIYDFNKTTVSLTAEDRAELDKIK